MKVAIVHDYLYQFGGAEKCVEKWLEIYPKADIYTSFFVPSKFSSSKIITQSYEQKRIKTTILQKIFENPFFLKFQKHLFFVYPIVFSFFKVKNYDLVLISSTFCAKNIKIQNCSKIVFYCHTPTRFLWNLISKDDHKSLSIIYRILMPFLIFPLKILDQRAVKNLNRLGCIWLANSEFIRQTIKQIYKTESKVVFPPIELDKFLPIKRLNSSISTKPFYLSHGRISFHKRIDLAILACLKMRRHLKISGSSVFPAEIESLKKIVREAEKKDLTLLGLIEFVGKTNEEQLKKLMQNCEAFLFPGKEDFGIAPIEMLAGGVPIIAYKAGGALEYIIEKENGIFFEEQNTQNLIQAIQKFEAQKTWNVQNIKKTSQKFEAQKFINYFKEIQINN
jgi:glycosyltransferase involved in cell wall biosynthesis